MEKPTNNGNVLCITLKLAISRRDAGSATPERVTFQRASFERTIFSDCTSERLTIGAIHHLGECHFSDYQIQRVPISTEPIWASIPRLPGTVWAKVIIAKSRGSSRGQETGPCLPKGQNSNIFFNCPFMNFCPFEKKYWTLALIPSNLVNSVFEQLYELRHNTYLVILAPLCFIWRYVIWRYIGRPIVWWKGKETACVRSSHVEC